MSARPILPASAPVGRQCPAGAWYQVPPARWSLQVGEAVVCSVALVDTPAETAGLERLLSGAELERADRFRTAPLRNAFVAAHAALRAILAGCLGVPAASLVLAHGPYGKPELPGERLRFNLSHSADRALIALALDRAVGVDLERIRALPDLDDIARGFFAPQEQRDLLSLPSELRERAFFACWSRKEAYIKAVGMGLSLPLASFRVNLLPGDAPALLASAHDRRTWSLYDVSPHLEFAAALACEGAPGAVRGWSFPGACACARYFAQWTGVDGA